MPRLYSVDDAAVYLRTIVRYVLGEAAISEDPSTDIDKAVIQIKTIDTR